MTRTLSQGGWRIVVTDACIVSVSWTVVLLGIEILRPGFVSGVLDLSLLAMAAIALALLGVSFSWFTTMLDRLQIRQVTWSSISVLLLALTIFSLQVRGHLLGLLMFVALGALISITLYALIHSRRDR